MTVPIVLVDDRTLGRSGIKALLDLTPYLRVVGEADDAASTTLDGMRAGAGQTLFRPGATERSLHECADPSAHPPHHHADAPTLCEVEILRLMTGGFNNRKIAEALNNSEGTIKNHVSSILSKLGVRDRVRAVLRCLGLSYV